MAVALVVRRKSLLRRFGLLFLRLNFFSRPSPKIEFDEDFVPALVPLRPPSLFFEGEEYACDRPADDVSRAISGRGFVLYFRGIMEDKLFFALERVDFFPFIELPRRSSEIHNITNAQHHKHK